MPDDTTSGTEAQAPAEITHNPIPPAATDGVASGLAWFDEAATINPSAWPGLRIEPITATPAMTNPENALRQHLTDAGFSVLEDYEVEDRGDYAVWVNPTFYYPIVTVDPHRSNLSLRSLDVPAKSVIYTKPLRVVGTWAYSYGESRRVMELFVEDNLQRGTRRIPGNADQHIEYPWRIPSMRDAVRVPNGTKPRMSREQRRAHIKSKLHLLYADGAIGVTAYKTRLLMAVEIGDRGYATHRGTRWAHFNAFSYRNAMAWLKEFGRDYVGAAHRGDEPDPDEAIDLLGQITAAGVNVDSCIDAWNGAVFSQDELERAGCGHVVRSGDAHTVYGDTTVCADCLDEDYTWCTDTDQYHRCDDAYLHEDGEHRSYPEEDDGDDDDGSEGDGGHYLNSWGSSTSCLAHDTSFTPSPTGDFTLGVELEVESNTSSERRGAHAKADNHFNGTSMGQYAMFKTDGSLNRAKGFEIVTAARRMGDHIKMFSDWKPDGNLTAWDAEHCGMHVHIDSRAFTSLSLGKFLMLYNAPENENFITSIAGRHPSTDDAAADYAGALERTHNPRVVKSRTENSSRYRMVNVTNLTEDEQQRLQMHITNRDSKGDYSTVEVRIFRATLRKARLLAQIEFAHASVEFCRLASWSDLSETAFKTWLAKAPGYPHLTRWFGTSRARNSRYTARESARSASVEV